MPKGYLIVKSQPSPEQADAYHDWYENSHIPELLAVDGFVSARRLSAVEGDSYLAIYEVDDVDGAKAAMAEAQAAGTMTRPAGLQLDPPPVVEWYTEVHSATA
jgi:hypothetical protein